MSISFARPFLTVIGAVALVSAAGTAGGQQPPAPKPAPKPAPATAANAPLPAEQAAMKAHVMFLASDALQGRDTGSAEYDIAAQYVAAQFYAAGLRPAGDAGSYLQRVPIVTYRAAGEGDFVWTTRASAPRKLVFGEDYVPLANGARAQTTVSAPVVFVGQGIVAPQYGRDDYKGVDVRGKIVAYFNGASSRFNGEERAFFNSPATKAQLAQARGAIGVLTLENAVGAAGRSFSRMVAGYDAPRVAWGRPDGTGAVAAPDAPSLGTISVAGAEKLFAGAKVSWASVAAEAAKTDPTYRAVQLPGTLSVATRTTLTSGVSSNVVGVIPGADPVVGKEVVVLSGHLDHIGVKDGGDGDRINNGALDNAIGVASLIEEARRFAESGTPPKRTIMFLAVTAEEKGLVGSDYFVNNPTVPIKSIVANVNLDMPVLTYKFEDMTVFGADRSTLGPIVRQAVAAIGVGLSPDPMPQQGFFVRSDHFRFVQKGIPSVFLWPGPGGAGKAAFEKFLSSCYHRPCDDVSQPIDWGQGVRFVDVNYRIARAIADAPTRPVWNRGDYFGTLYKGPMAK